MLLEIPRRRSLPRVRGEPLLHRRAGAGAPGVPRERAVHLKRHYLLKLRGTFLRVQFVATGEKEKKDEGWWWSRRKKGRGGGAHEHTGVVISASTYHVRPWPREPSRELSRTTRIKGERKMGGERDGGLEGAGTVSKCCEVSCTLTSATRRVTWPRWACHETVCADRQDEV